MLALVQDEIVTQPAGIILTNLGIVLQDEIAHAAHDGLLIIDIGLLALVADKVPKVRCQRCGHQRLGGIIEIGLGGIHQVSLGHQHIHAVGLLQVAAPHQQIGHPLVVTHLLVDVLAAIYHEQMNLAITCLQHPVHVPPSIETGFGQREVVTAPTFPVTGMIDLYGRRGHLG